MKRLVAGLVVVASSLSGCFINSSCVGRGTTVSTPSGKRRVEELVIGDEIIVVEPTLGQHSVSVITHIVSADRECGQLHFSDGSSLRVTSNHPLFDPSDRAFHPAGDWLLGERSTLLRFENDAFEVVTVTARTAFVDVRTVFDLTVESPWHTFVAEGIVVHNKPFIPQCTLPDGGATRELEGDTCSCGADAGTGWFTCSKDGDPYVCSECQK